MKRIDAEVLATLRASRVEGDRLFLPPGQLPRKLYERTDEVLRALGGRWCSRSRTHRFERDPSEALSKVLDDGAVATARDLGWFPTPAALARSLVERAAVTPGARVLEPSAGEGAIVEALLCAGAEVTAIEIEPRRVERLRARFPQVTVVEGDFLAKQPRDLGVFAAVVMNPPFSVDGLQGADVAHVSHALEFVRYRGALVAVMSAGAASRETGLAPKLRAQIDELEGVIEPLPEGVFRASGTDVRAVVATLREVGRC